MKTFKTLFFFLSISLFTIQSNNSSAQWEIYSNGITGGANINSLVASGNTIYAGTQGEGVYRSSNSGVSWTAVNNGLTQLSVYALCVSGQTIFAGTFNGLFKSTNNGAEWTSSGTGTGGSSIYTFAASGSTIFAVGNAGIFRSNDNGANWTELINGLPMNFSATAVTVTSSYVIVGENNTVTAGGIYRSSDGGNNWTLSNTGLSNGNVTSLASSGSIVLAGTAAGVYVSTTDGVNWASANGGLSSLFFTNTIYSYENKFFLGTNPNGGCFLTTNAGSNWLDKNQGFSGPQYVRSFVVANNYIFAAKYHSVWRRTYSETIGIQNLSSEVPNGYLLGQNYPNPFNPSTNIEFWIPGKLHVNLSVYDQRGNKVAVLVDETLPPGSYRASFEGSNFASGVYFYRLTSPGFSRTGKMTLLK